MPARVLSASISRCGLRRADSVSLTSHRAASRIAAISLLIVICAAFGFGLGFPLAQEYRLAFAEVAQYRVALDGYQRIAQRETSLRQAIEELKRDRSLKQVLLPLGSDSGATAAIQDRVQSIIGNAGAWLTSVQPLAATLDDGHKRIGMRVAFATDIEALRDILYALEYGQPVMILEGVYVHARTSRAIGVGYPLDVRIDVFAFKADNT